MLEIFGLLNLAVIALLWIAVEIFQRRAVRRIEALDQKLHCIISLRARKHRRDPADPEARAKQVVSLLKTVERWQARKR